MKSMTVLIVNKYLVYLMLIRQVKLFVGALAKMNTEGEKLYFEKKEVLPFCGFQGG